MKHYYLQFAQAYGEGTYDQGVYAGETTTTTGGTGTPSPASGGTLANTGEVLVFIAAIACTLIFVALVVRFWKRPAKTATVSVLAEDGQQNSKL